MKILLLGEYSNVHATLAKGLRALGHEVLVVSNGDFWKSYPRDIDLSRSSTRLGALAYLLKLAMVLPKLRGFDVVQIINPMFLELKAERMMPVYRYLRRNNGKMFMGAFGMDYYWVDVCCKQMPLRYSDFNIGKRLRGKLLPTVTASSPDCMSIGRATRPQNGLRKPLTFPSPSTARTRQPVLPTKNPTHRNTDL